MELKLESTWTRPRADCQHPEWWHATDSDSTEIEVSELVAGFVRALQPNYVVETGTAFGQTAQLIGEALKANGHGFLHSLEVDADRVKSSIERCLGLPVAILQIESLKFEPTETIDFAFLDSLIPLRVSEFNRFRPYMRKGTIVGFHDTGPQHGRWSRELARMPGTRAISLPTPRGVTFVEVL